MSRYLETVKCTKTVIVDPINNISAKINNAVTSCTYTTNGMIINGNYYWLETVEGVEVENIIAWENSTMFTWAELNALYSVLNVQYPPNPTYEQRTKADISAGLLYVTQQDKKFGTVASDWIK
jgi:hypothetical protein